MRDEGIGFKNNVVDIIAGAFQAVPHFPPAVPDTISQLACVVAIPRNQHTNISEQLISVFVIVMIRKNLRDVDDILKKWQELIPFLVSYPLLTL